jgi:two-component system CheB/CheR fusion protein
MPTKKKDTTKKSEEPVLSKPQQGPELKTSKFPVVGIGASAGGLEAFTDFLKNLPADTDMAFVFVQHQDPTHDSALPHLLRKVSKLPLDEAENGMQVKKNHVYVIPPNTNMTIDRGFLRLGRRDSLRPHLPIDSFFQSLAHCLKEKAIGVILSGTASDGTIGLKAIKGEDGITFAQDESAKYDGMPKSAIAAGVIDFVLPPHQIAAEISRIGTHPFVKTELDETTLVKEPDSVSTILQLIRKSTGVDFTHYKPTTVMRRITRRMVFQKMDDPKAYANHLKVNPKELLMLYEDILINVTSFFRDPETFEILKAEIFPKILKKAGPRSIRIWVPGCSTGEEPYSIAIALLEYLGDQTPGTEIQIFATDISEGALEKARSGLFAHDIVNEVRADRLRRFFTKTKVGYQIHKMIRDMCIFAKHNVAKDPPFSRLDLISCRNLLIYFGPILQKKVVPIFHYALNANGYLLLGGTESIGGFGDYFYPGDKRFKIFVKKPMPTRVHFEADQFPTAFMPPEHPNEVLQHITTEKDILKEGDRLLLSRYAPASVIVNEDFQILQFRGKTGPYLEPTPGQASLNLLKMAREGIGMELRSAFLQAKKDGSPVEKRSISYQIDGVRRVVDIEVIPFQPGRGGDRFFLILFEDADQSKISKEKFVPKKPRLTDELDVLRNELAATKEYLQSIIEEQEATNEELRAANEEILSSNEELQSTNEEMETAKEELQSSNEELTTVNEELQVRNTELSLVNNDLNNLISSTPIAILMVGSDLSLRRYTPSAENIMKILSGDVGRIINDVNLDVSPRKLQGWITDVIDNIQMKEIEVQDRSGRWYELIIRPYKTLDNKIDGAVLALINIDSLKRNADEFRKYQNYCEAIVDTMNEPLILLNDQFKIKMANRKFYDQFKVAKKETINKDFFSLANGQWNIKELRKLIQDILPKKTEVEDYLVEHKFDGMGKRRLYVNARRMDLLDINEHLILIQFANAPLSKPRKN